jgi:hypothetical protein
MSSLAVIRHHFRLFFVTSPLAGSKLAPGGVLINDFMQRTGTRFGPG